MNRLTATKLRSIKPTKKIQKLWDGGGLHLIVTPAGGMSWKWKYRLHGKEQLKTFGKYPDISLAQARELHREAQAQLASGVPSQRSVATFQEIGDRWHDMNSSRWVLSVTKRVRHRLEKDIYPVLGSYPIQDINTRLVLDCLRRIESRGVGETVKRCKSIISQVMRFGIGEGYCDQDPTVHLRGVLKPAPRTRHHPAPTDPERVREIYRILKESDGNKSIKGVCLMAFWTLQRSSELRRMEWDHIRDGQWSNYITKTETELIVPLPKQAQLYIQDLEGWHPRWVFPGTSHNGQISENAPVNYLRFLGLPATEINLHGVRATGRTLITEELEYADQFVEHQLSHMPRVVHGRAYDRAKYIRQRTEMMQNWADWLEG
ncbi:integrase arm-type DNA-binding domain-containing protein [Ruegeria sp. HKCCD4332]|uniref:tyrosine-type recombinase/integrase n=1 Tax=Ruegeria sp. HKCCD4332 TaxID=2683021 RepID=UPI0014923E61|nr:integrase arm-type DNA-binding domain-containing protein [Ruegeria sp. HKCCD4332]NOD78909.1 integrase arm-type DNA-binding domain-containing protein [Ruegeria sp. HKCCD4332]